MSSRHRWILVSSGDSDDRWAWSGIPESIARALRARGEDVLRLSCDLPASIERNGARIAGRIPGLTVTGYDLPLFVRLRSARLRRQDVDWTKAKVVVFGSTFWAPRVDATFEDITVAQLPGVSESGARERWRRRQGAIYMAASRCFTSTEWAATSVREDYSQPKEKIVVAGFGANVVCRPVSKDWSRPRLLWVGLDWHRKGGDVLLDAFRIASVEGATLDLVGHHPNVDMEAVTGHGLVRDPDRLRAMYEAATLFVLPSRFDASPIACLEAATAGTPVVATRTGGTAEHVGDAGEMVEAGSVQGLAAAIRRMAQPAVAARCRQAAITQSRTRTWGWVARRMIDAFEGDVSRPSERGWEADAGEG